jgi:hypothetical protein
VEWLKVKALSSSPKYRQKKKNNKKNPTHKRDMENKFSCTFLKLSGFTSLVVYSPNFF